VDPDLQDQICVCPEPGCRDGFVWPGDEQLERPCTRCEGVGYIDCTEVDDDEPYETMATQRSKIIVNLENES
jgi:hypothetical protein